MLKMFSLYLKNGCEYQENEGKKRKTYKKRRKKGRSFQNRYEPVHSFLKLLLKATHYGPAIVAIANCETYSVSQQVGHSYHLSTRCRRCTGIPIGHRHDYVLHVLIFNRAHLQGSVIGPVQQCSNGLIVFPLLQWFLWFSLGFLVFLFLIQQSLFYS